MRIQIRPYVYEKNYVHVEDFLIEIYRPGDFFLN